jgi:RND family efflux transporter MFP subunit
MRGSGPVAIALGLVVALAATAFLPRAGRGPGVPVATVARAPFVQEVAAEGNLRAVRATPLAVPAAAGDALRIAWLAADGTQVHAGDVVARFDPTTMEKNLREAGDDVETARVKAMKARAEGAAEMRKLQGDGEIANLELQGAERFQKKDETIFSRAERIESEIDGELAHAHADHAAAAQRTRSELSRAELELIEIQRRQAEAKVARARAGLEALTLTAPHDGILTFRRDWRREIVRVGDTVWPGEPIGDLPDLSRLEAEVFVLEADAGGLAAGKPATVTLESAPDVVYPATVARVDTLAKPRFRGSPVQYFAVVLALARTDPARMKPGARVAARLTLDRLPSALAVPREAVFERDGRSVVYRRRGASFEPVPVVLGPTARGRVVIRSGLAPGDEVALGDPTRTAAPAAGSPDAGSPAAPAARPAP